MMTREEILGLDDLEVSQITVPHWGEINIRMMSALERQKVESVVQRMTEDNQAEVMAELKALVASIVVCDDNGKSIFKADDLRALGGKNHKALEAILKAVQGQAALTPDAVEEQEGN